MTRRALAAVAAGILVCMVLVATGCDDDEPTGSAGTTEDKGSETKASEPPGLQAVKDVEPRAAKPNLAGGSAPIADLAETAAGDALVYWQQVFDNSELQYAVPTVQVLTQPADDGCGMQFDPARQPVFLCVDASADSTISLGAPSLDEIRSSSGDGAVAFLAGYPPALDAVTQLLGKEKKLGEHQLRVAACFNGTWIRNLASRDILEEGDDQEVLDAAVQTVPGADAELGPQLVATGFTKGLAACQELPGG